jgi:hypothetical protein
VSAFVVAVVVVAALAGSALGRVIVDLAIAPRRPADPLAVRLVPGTVAVVDEMRWRLTDWELARGPLLNGGAILSLRFIPADRHLDAS